MAFAEPIETKILERTIAVIEAHGEVGVRTHTIAQDCGVTAPVLYRLFGNREGLIIAAQAERYLRTFTIGSNNIAIELAHRVKRCLSRNDVIDAMKWFLQTAMSPQGHRQRMVRLEIVGSAATRPKLMEAVAKTQNDLIVHYAEVFEVVTEHGWVNQTIDRRAMVALWTGLILGRFIPEVSGGLVDDDAWNALATEAILHLMFGELDLI
jgi:AcrR family transcriptional regulator